MIFLLLFALSGLAAEQPEPPRPVTFLYIENEILAKRCVDCHGPAKAKKGVHLDTYEGVSKRIDFSSLKSSDLIQITRNGDMPPENATALTNEEIELIREWVLAGALDN